VCGGGGGSLRMNLQTYAHIQVGLKISEELNELMR